MSNTPLHLRPRFDFKEIGPRPDRLLLRKRDIMRWIGVTKHYLSEIIAAGLLPWKVLVPKGLRYYRREDVEFVFLKKFRREETHAGGRK